MIGSMKEYSDHRSKTQQRVYDAVVNYITKNGYAPSTREISKETHISISSTNECLHELESMGKIEMKPNSPRAISVVGYEYRRIGDDQNGKR